MTAADEYDLAVVGMAIRVPGADTPDRFWANLVRGVESITTVTDEEAIDAGMPPDVVHRPNYVRAAAALDRPDGFDAAFFEMSGAEAKAMDPQHRILLELAHEALESAGYDPARTEGRVGVFAGSALNTYLNATGLAANLQDDYIPTLIGNDKDFLATRICYKLDLKGPGVSVQTACSTSLVAVHLARQSLLTGETDMCLAGAISVRIPHRAGYLCDAGGIVSPDGHVRAFDAGANGTVFGSGGGVVVLKRLSDALAAGDTVHAVIKGTAINNDGSRKAGYSAPSVAGQADAVLEALANAGVDADTVGLVEAHGSGTPVGDPIEVRALTQAFRASTSRNGYCAIGSVKTNVGHLDVAAGMAGLVKAVLALGHRCIPPSLNFARPNPEIEFDGSPFYVNVEVQPWSGETPRRAVVTSTGMGGTNACVVLEEGPPADTRATGRPVPAQLLVLSARSPQALDIATQRLRAHLESHTSVDLGDVAHTLQVGRKALPFRRAVACTDRAGALVALAGGAGAMATTGRVPVTPPPVVFMFPGVGDQYVGMAHGLVEAFPSFQRDLDQCAGILEPLVGADIREAVYPASRSWTKRTGATGLDLRRMIAGRDAERDDPEVMRLNQTRLVQPALFAIEYATARLWLELGVAPRALVGHSMGEYVAACLAGVMRLEDALRLIACRANLVGQLPAGAMLAVMLPEAELAALLPPSLSISLINGPSLCVVAGSAEAVDAFAAELGAREVLFRRVANGHAFHSRMIEPIVEDFVREVSKVALHPPRIPFVSNVTGTWITAEQATDPAYWGSHACRTARFDACLRALAGIESAVLLEVGPGRTLVSLASQHPAFDRSGPALGIASVRPYYERRDDVQVFLHGVGQLWAAGGSVDWDRLPSNARRRVPLPTYPFERESFWIRPMASSSDVGRPPPPSNPAPLGIDEWFNVPTWHRLPSGLDARVPAESTDERQWLVLAPPGVDVGALRSRLVGAGRQVEVVILGGAPDEAGSRPMVAVDRLDDYIRTLRALSDERELRLKIVHLGGLASAFSGPGTLSERVWAARGPGFRSLMCLGQAIGELGSDVSVLIGFVTRRMHDVTGDEAVDPSMATALGPCGVIPKELPGVSSFSVDLPDDGPFEALSPATLDALIAEFDDPRPRVVAYRGAHRWERRFVPVRLPPSSAAAGSTSGRWRKRGVYLITGGTGGIGLSVARRLATRCRARLVLTRRQPFPPRERWRELVGSGDTPGDQRATLEALLEIEAAGSRVDVVQADCTDRERMSAVIESIRVADGRIDGVIHAAGIVEPGMIEARSLDAADAVLAPKVLGTAILFELVSGLDLDVFVLFSSNRSVLTPFGESDYSGANAFLDAFVPFANANASFRTMSICWPGWRDVGLLANLRIQAGMEGWKQDELRRAISPADGVEAFERIVDARLPHVVVSPEPLDRLILESERPSALKQAAADREPERVNASFGACDVDRELVDVWRRVLAIDEIGVDNSFAQLGVHSLLAMQVVSRIRARFAVDLSLREFMEAETVARLGEIVRGRVAARAADGHRARARPLDDAGVIDASRPPVPDARLGRDASGRPAWFVPVPGQAGKYRPLS